MERESAGKIFGLRILGAAEFQPLLKALGCPDAAVSEPEIPFSGEVLRKAAAEGFTPSLDTSTSCPPVRTPIALR